MVVLVVLLVVILLGVVLVVGVLVGLGGLLAGAAFDVVVIRPSFVVLGWLCRLLPVLPRINIVLVGPSLVGLLRLLSLGLGVFARVHVILIRPAFVCLLRRVLLFGSVVAGINVVIITPALVLRNRLRGGLLVLVTGSVEVVQTEVVLLRLSLLLCLRSPAEVCLVVELLLRLLLPPVTALIALILLVALVVVASVISHFIITNR